MPYHIRGYCLVAVLIVLLASCVTGDSSECGTGNCKSNDVQPLNENCHYFCFCVNGHYQKIQCTLGRYYDQYTKKCVDSTSCPTTTTTTHIPPHSSTPANSTTTTSTTAHTSTNSSTTTTTTPHTSTNSSTTTTTTAHTSTNSSTTTTIKPTIKPREPCSKEEEKRATSDCHKFQVCTKGYWGDALSCSLGYYFNKKNLDCELNTLCYYCNCL